MPGAGRGITTPCICVYCTGDIMKRRFWGILIVLISLGGIALMAYPFLGYWYNELHQAQVVQEYDNFAAQISEADWMAERKKAEEYNRGLVGRVELTDPFEPGSKDSAEAYHAILNVRGNGQMGSIRIPDIKIQLPIYHGTASDVLDKGVGHLENTSFPIGGKGTHAVLSAHTGSPTADFFTNLEQLTEGAEFYISIMDEVLAYKVNQIKVVEPDQIGDLTIDREKDYLTLVTCTPYGVNSHRLLVRGERIEYRAEAADKNVFEDITGPVMSRRFIMGIVSAAVLIVSFIIFLKIKKKYKKLH